MEQINPSVIFGIVSVAVIGGITLAAKETIGNVWAAIIKIINDNIKNN